jgi:thioredoxin reductase (NADPH)
VTFVEYLGHSIAEKVLQDRVKGHEKTTCMFSHMATEVKGDNLANAVVIENRETGEKEEIHTAAVFIYVGYKPYTDIVKDLVKLDDYGYIITDKDMRTSVPGIFAAGDVVSENLAQVAVAVGDGAKAAVGIREYLQNL